MSLPKQLLEIEVNQSKSFPPERYGYLNLIISTRFNKSGIYFTMKNEGDKVTVTRLKEHPRADKRTTYLEMKQGESIVGDGKESRACRVIVGRLEDQGLGKWSVVTSGDIFSVKRIV